MTSGIKPGEGPTNPEGSFAQQTNENPEELLAKAPKTQKQMGQPTSDLTLTLSDEETKEFEQLAKKELHDFVYTSGEEFEGNPEEKVVSALVDFVIKLHNHILTKTNHLPKNKRKMITALKNILVFLDDGLPHSGAIKMLKEKDENKLPELAHEVFLDIVDLEAEIAEKDLIPLNTLRAVISKMPV